MKCPICTNERSFSPVELTMQACAACAETIGIQPMPPVTREPKACSCGCRKFLRAIPREHTATGNDYVHERAAPMRVTHAPRGNPGIFSGSAYPIDITAGFGRLELFLCFGCGKVEWYCPDVASIPIHPHLMTDIVDYDAGSPFRG